MLSDFCEWNCYTNVMTAKKDGVSCAPKNVALVRSFTFSAITRNLKAKFYHKGYTFLPHPVGAQWYYGDVLQKLSPSSLIFVMSLVASSSTWCSDTLFKIFIFSSHFAPPPKWPILCRVERWTLLTHSLTFWTNTCSFIYGTACIVQNRHVPHIYKVLTACRATYKKT